MSSDKQPDRLRLVADPGQRLSSNDQNDEPHSQRGNPRMAGNADDDLRISRIGSVDPMEELSDIDEDEDTEYDLDDDEADAEESPRSRLLPIATAVLALLGFAGIIWYAYQWGAGSVAPEELPVIRAETAPSKIRPESPGGLVVPYQETLALNNLQPDPEKPQVERLLPPPETPLPPPRIAAAPAPTPTTQVPTTQAPATEVVTPVPPASAAPPAPDTKAAVSTQEPPKQQAPATKAPAPAVPAPAVSIPVNGFVLQLASLKAKERAPVLWSRLQKSFPGLLTGKQLVVASVDLAGRGTFYRVQAGYFSDRASAEAVCKQLKAKRQDCLVTKL